MQTKEEFIKTLGDNVLKGYKRKKLKDFPNANSDDNTAETTIREATDMEIEDPDATNLEDVQFTRPPPPPEQPPPTPPPPATPPSCESPINAFENEKRNSITQSPSLLELEKQKQKLLQELQANTSVVEIEDSLIDEIIALDESSNSEDTKCTEQEKLPLTNDNVNNTPEKSVDSSVVAEKDANNPANTVIKESLMGTPVLKFSPYDNLPKGDNFKVGVSDVINFENLPDSTGKYEQMKEVIKKVRTCITKLQSEE